MKSILLVTVSLVFAQAVFSQEKLMKLENAVTNKTVFFKENKRVKMFVRDVKNNQLKKVKGRFHCSNNENIIVGDGYSRHRVY